MYQHLMRGGGGGGEGVGLKQKSNSDLPIELKIYRHALASDNNDLSMLSWGWVT